MSSAYKGTLAYAHATLCISVLSGGTTARDGGSAAARWDEQEVCYIVLTARIKATATLLVQHYSMESVSALLVQHYEYTTHLSVP
jgi:hypothetical protein